MCLQADETEQPSDPVLPKVSHDVTPVFEHDLCTWEDEVACGERIKMLHTQQNKDTIQAKLILTTRHTPPKALMPGTETPSKGFKKNKLGF